MEDIEPTEAVEMYIADKQPELAQSTVYSHKSRPSHFTEWCAGDGGIEYLSELDPIDCHRYKLWRRDEHDINNVTLKTQLDTLRVFSAGQIGHLMQRRTTSVRPSYRRHSTMERMNAT
jgi:hypothetical protein